MGKNYHITKRPDGGWQAIKPNAGRASGVFDTQAEAEQRAKQWSHNAGGGEVTIHRPNGEIRDRDTVAPAKDPNPPRDTKN